MAENTIITQYQQLLIQGDFALACELLKKSVKAKTLSPTTTMRISMLTLEYMDYAYAKQIKSKQLEDLLLSLVKICPGNIFALDSVVMYYAEILHDNIVAYIYIQRIAERCVGQLTFPACVRGYQTCFALRRIDEAEEWVRLADKHAHSQENKQIVRETQCKILADKGLYAEAAALAESLLPSSRNKLKMHRNIALWYQQSAQYDKALHHANEAMCLSRDLQSLLRIAHISYKKCLYAECLAYVHEALHLVEAEYDVSIDSSERDNERITLRSDIAKDHIEHFIKLAIKASVRLNDPNGARAFLYIGKRYCPWYGTWEDIEDLWPDDHDEFDGLVVKHCDNLSLQYPSVPISAIRCIARAEAFYEFVKAPELWYSMICREYGVAFEIILRNIVCHGEQSMSLAELIDYISGRPGDPLYGGYSLLDTLRKIRNKGFHTDSENADDVERSRRILFEEVLAKL